MSDCPPRSAPVLTRERAFEELKRFFDDKPLLWFGTGPSCAVDRDFGMGALAAELRRRLDTGKLGLTDDGQRQWEEVRRRLEEKKDLETSMAEVEDPRLVEAVEAATGDFVADVDQRRIGQLDWPLLPLLRRLVETYEQDRTLHVVTPNYDLLLEHACDDARLPYATGFVGGVMRHWDPSRAMRGMWRPETIVIRGRQHRTSVPVKHIRLHKMHGSLNWFEHDGAVVETDAWLYSRPDGKRRLVVTPGLGKFERTMHDREVLLSPADRAIEAASSFLFVGYGFADAHLDRARSLRTKLVEQGCPTLVVTRDASHGLLELAEKAPNLWVVCRVDEQGCDDTRIRHPSFADWLPLPGEKWWDILEFTRKVLGVGE